MTIRKKMKLCMVVAISLAMATTLVVFYRGQLLKESFRKTAFFDQVIKGTSELNYLALGFALYQGDRFKTQWHQRHASLEKHLLGAELTGDDDKAAVADMRHEMAVIKDLFEQVVSNYDSAGSLAGIARDMKLETNERILARLLARAQGMDNDATRLAEANKRKDFIVQRRVFFTILGLSLFMVLVIAFIAFVLSRSVIDGLKALEEGAEAISSGNMDRRIAVRSNDEIGNVSRVFNDMASKLKENYLELQKSHDELEHRVEERTAELQERTKQLEVLNRELESFSFSVSHDLRAPLRAIDGYSRMLVKKYGSAFNEDASRMIDLVRRNTEMMSNLIEDLLAFSKVQKTGMSLSKIDMDALARETWDSIRTAHPEREIEFTITKLLPGFGDRALIRQVLFNLISNAVKFTKNRKPGIIEMSSYTEPGGKVVYCLKDRGVGFDMAFYDRLFGVFQRLHAQEEYEGTGVGLAIVQRIVNRHGGEVWAEGKVDEGATFYFTLKKWNAEMG